MTQTDSQRIIDNYRQLLRAHGSGPQVGQWSPEGQLFRFEKLAAIADLDGTSVLDIGCGLGDLLPFLRARYPRVRYTGIDFVPELVADAARMYPNERFCHADFAVESFSGSFDYALISGVFNNQRGDAAAMLKTVLRRAFAVCTRGMAFNFISTRVNSVDPEMAYHDPVEVLRFCLDELSNKVVMAHHYERCDVAVYVYRA